MKKGKHRVVVAGIAGILLIGILLAGIVFCMTPRRMMRLFGSVLLQDDGFLSPERLNIPDEFPSAVR